MSVRGLQGMLFDRLSVTLERHLDFRLERGNLLAANLANVDTPGYTPVDLHFDEALAQALSGGSGELRRTDGRHLPDRQEATRGVVAFDLYALPDADGNSVDLDHEMSKLAENQLLYQAMARGLNKRLALLRYAIQEGQG